MNDSRIASRYARALYALAGARDIVGAVKADLDQLAVLSGQSEEFRMLLESPVLKGSQKSVIFRNLFTGKVEEITLHFLQLLVDHKREIYLPAVCRMFMKFYKADLGVLEAKVESAQVFDKELLESLRTRLEKSTHNKIDMTTTLNEELIGGFRLTVEDQQLDASVLTQLKKIKTELRESKK
ncbi:MAG TPA: ATP synthase F1 subunit delta [Bacteroidales bacterium]|nr:ATP synthase F1 subunit delta [Bacteroidales bacterium]